MARVRGGRHQRLKEHPAEIDVGRTKPPLNPTLRGTAKKAGKEGKGAGGQRGHKT
jgi:hypothetical protein